TFFGGSTGVPGHKPQNPAEPIASKLPPLSKRIVIEAIRCAYDAMEGTRRKPPIPRVARGGTALFATEGEAEIDFAPDFERSHGGEIWKSGNANISVVRRPVCSHVT